MWRIAAFVAALSLVSLIFVGLGQGYDTSGFPPSAIEKFLYKQHRTKLFIIKSKISEMKRIPKEDKETDSTDTAKTDQKRTEDKKKDSEDAKGGQNATTAKKQQDDNAQKKETCDVNPAPGVIKGHGPCITQFPHQPAARGGMDDCWRLAFAVAQWKQPRNPLKAEYGDDWKAAAKAYPHTASQAQQIADDFNKKTDLPVYREWSPKHPYVRLCVPTKCGLSKNSGCDLKETDFLMHLNPGPKEIDNTTHLFYKGFVRDGHLMLPNAGLTAH